MLSIRNSLVTSGLAATLAVGYMLLRLGIALEARRPSRVGEALEEAG